MEKITRVIFNFTSKCNLPCDFCYIPFDNIDSRDLELWKRIVDRCKDLGAEILTFGGGDPFLYREFPKLLEHAFDGKIFIQIDTNALALHEEHLSFILKYANLVGLPIEGNEQIHSAMRGNNRHYSIVLKWLGILSEYNVQIKINTVLSKKNNSNLFELAEILSKFRITKWSIYQFWALGRGKEYRDEYDLSYVDFLESTDLIKQQFPNLKIEASSSTLRHKSYFFVSHTGRVYVMTESNQEEYTEIGNIFDLDIVDKWEKHGDYESLRKRTELRKKF